MNTKLTLRLDETLIHSAKIYAKKEGKSISQIVSEYFKAIHKKNDIKILKLRPLTTKLFGSLKEHTISRDEYKKHAEKKYL